MYPAVSLYIDGAWTPSASGKTLQVMNPATGDTLGALAHAGTDDLDRALAAVDRGFQVWRKVSAYDRSKIMRKAAGLVRERVDQIAALMTQEQGKPLAEAKMEVGAAADVIEWFAEEARRAYGRVIPARAAGVYQLVIKEPVGPVACFTPWNFPINQAVRKISAALAAGCSVILKGPEETPASCAELVRAYADAGVPAGVVNLVYGIPSEISEYLIPHPVIRKISFTGSTAGGQATRRARRPAHEARDDGAWRPRAGDRVRRCRRRAGEHDARRAASSATPARSACRRPASWCRKRSTKTSSASSSAIAEKIKVGDGMDPSTKMGPLANPRRITAMEGFISDAVQKGATVKTGGKRIGNKGNFFEPTVLTDLNRDMRVMNEEPFGPLALMVPFKHFDDVVEEANRLPFGLASYAFTSSAKTANAVAAAVEAGMMTINHIGLALPEVPFGGIKDSGYGSEGGSEAIEAYLNTKFVTQA